MKKWISRLLVALSLCSLIENKIEANCCYDYCDDTCAGPLSPCSFSLQLKGGVAPTHFTERGRFWTTAPAITPPVFSVKRTSRFRKQFDTPWEAGLELGYALNDRTQLFLEGIYQQGDGKRNNFTASTFSVSERTDDYKTWGCYIGARYFFNQWFCCLSPFIGFKAGFTHTKRVAYGLTLQDIFIQRSSYYHSTTGPSAGVQIGFDYNFCCNWNAVLTFEAVASHALKNNRNIVFNRASVVSGATGGITNVSVGETGYLVSFPITLGIRYDF